MGSNTPWVDGSAGGTPVNAVRLNTMQSDIDAAASTAASALSGLAGKANTSHTHTSSQITDFLEATQDVVGAMVTAGANVTATYDDSAGTITISSTGGGSLDTEAAQDMVATFVVAGAGINKTYDDAGNTLTIAVNLTYATAPAGSVFYTTGTTRPTARTDVLVIFNGADPGANALDGDLWFRAT